MPKAISELNPKTVQAYEKCLKKIDMDDFSDVNAVRDKIVEIVGDKDMYGNIRSDSQKARNIGKYISAAIYKLRCELEDILDDEEKYEITKLIEKYREILEQCGKVYLAGRDLNQLNEREEKNYIEWPEVIELRDKFEERYRKGGRYKKRDSRKLLIMSLYTYLPPRRIQDYLYMYYYEKRPDKLKELIRNKDPSLDDIFDKDYSVNEYGDIMFDDEEEEEKELPENMNNYYIKSENKFIFCKYKTAKSEYKKYGICEMEIPDELQKVLKSYFSWNEIEEGCRLLDFKDERALRQNISDLFNGANATRLRQSYISWFKKKNVDATVEDLKKLSREMGHNVSTQARYQKIKKDKNLREEQ
jgi:hypothetical protein